MKTIKILSAWLTVGLILLGQCVCVFAQEAAVSYEGQAQQFIFSPGSSYSLTDLFTGLKDVMPGDKLTDSIEIKNNSQNTIKVYMRALGAHKFGEEELTKKSKEFLSQMKLSVTQRNAAKLSDALADLSGGLADWVCLGTFQKGTKTVLDVTLEVPIEMGNDYQDAAGYVDWQFKVEEIANEAQKEPENKPSKPQNTYTSVKTGDSNQIWYYVVLVACAGIILWKMSHRQHHFSMIKWIQTK